MASRNFTALATKLATGAVNFDTGVFRALLVTVIPDETALDTWDFRNDVTNECLDADYTEGGFPCTVVVDAAVAGTDSVDINIDGTADPTYASPVTISAVGAIIFEQVGGDLLSPTTDHLVSFVDFTGTVASTAGAYDVTFTTPIVISVNV